MRTLLLISLIFFLVSQSDAQLIKSFGLKAGLAETSQKWEYFPSYLSVVVDTKPRPGFDVGIFAEWLDIPYISITTELHYVQKGAKCTTDLMQTVPANNPDGYVDVGYFTFTSRLDYLSLPLLMKLRFDLPVFSAYFFAGPRIDFFLSDQSTSPELSSKYLQKTNIGGTFGIGVQTLSLADINIGAEFRYSPSFQKSYSANYLTVDNQSMEFLLVFGF